MVYSKEEIYVLLNVLHALRDDLQDAIKLLTRLDHNNAGAQDEIAEEVHAALETLWDYTDELAALDGADADGRDEDSPSKLASP